jgi:hypothetical protein
VNHITERSPLNDNRVPQNMTHPVLSISSMVPVHSLCTLRVACLADVNNNTDDSTQKAKSNLTSLKKNSNFCLQAAFPVVALTAQLFPAQVS